MARQFLGILIFLLVMRPMTLVDNSACGQEAATSASSGQAVPDPIPTPEIPCADITQTSEVAETNHHCPCYALMLPALAGISTNSGAINLLAAAISTAETAVPTPPTPPPRLV